MSSRDASKGVPSGLLAFPSLSSSLHTLPQATSMKSVSLHPNMYNQPASEAKLQKALSSKTAAAHPSQNPAMTPYMRPTTPSSHCDSSPLMMRKPQKSK
ncbi:uncharacterized protein BT62DRAFT_937182 [Guyanagaster necrorhizus]|uniref:Uncharacterized protein n=1 Tax=Guyanagaster necrorhizus TaxID=856835 RepID=A0A9P7VIX4_9AGAR|nr:uncharacterized protein BT62DRAFT_937182 [Guyanagaster necrorhizus MCA 3950]KAG7441413.1 hypothetical protein BT62DRAFT_937182 [Guyanagaster necrorhizus MCA 3950]